MNGISMKEFCQFSIVTSVLHVDNIVYPQLMFNIWRNKQNYMKIITKFLT